MKTKKNILLSARKTAVSQKGNSRFGPTYDLVLVDHENHLIALEAKSDDKIYIPSSGPIQIIFPLGFFFAPKDPKAFHLLFSLQKHTRESTQNAHIR